MAYAAEASISRGAESVAESDDKAPSPPPALFPSTPQDAGGAASSAGRKAKEVQKSFLLTLPWIEPAPPLSQFVAKSSGGFTEASTELLLQNYRNFTSSAAPVRLMYLENGDWLDFSSEVMDRLLQAFVGGRAIVDASIEGSKYVFDFMRMLQIDFQTKNCWSVSWIDKNGKCFFPRVSIGKDEDEHSLELLENNKSNNHNNHKIELVIKVDDGALLKRKRAEFEVNLPNPPPNTALPAPPARARPPLIIVDDDDVPGRPRLEEVSRWPKATILREDDKDYVLLKYHFLSGVRKVDPGAEVTNIYQCKGNTEQKARYELFHKRVELTGALRGPNAAKLIHAWHGASAKDVATILASGFKSTTKVPASDVYGVGVYLSPLELPQFSADLAETDENGEKHVILCQILLGNVEKVEFGSQQDHPSWVEFDTGADDPDNPTWHVVWPCNMNKHIIPKCVVSYKPSVNAKGKGKMKAAPCSDEELLSKVKGYSLHPSLFQEVVHLLKIYRAGSLDKDTFIMRLRFIAGDNILDAVLQELDA